MLKNRLRQARENSGLDQAKVAEALNVARTTIVRWENGKSEPQMTQVRRLADLYGVSVIDLTGPAEVDKKATPEEVVSVGEDRVTILENQILVPVYRSIYACCGSGLCNEYLDDDEIEYRIPLSADDVGRLNGRPVYGIHVEGQSMEPAGITEDSIAIINGNIEPYRGAPCYVCYEKDGEVKDAIKFWFCGSDGTITLKAAQGTGVPDVIFRPEEAHSVTVRGIVTLTVNVSKPIQGW